MLFIAACTDTENEMSNHVPYMPNPEHTVAVASQHPNGSAVQTKQPSNIGKRNAAEMVAAGFKRYGLEKGIFIFRLDGAVNGTEYIYFDHWGWREGKYINTKSDIGTFDQTTDKIQFLDGERRYEYSPAKGEAYFFESKQVQKAANQYGTTDMTIVGDEMIKKMGGTVKGQNIIQGVTCQVWGVEKYRTELSMWRGITMGERSRAEGLAVARTCISIDTVSVVPLEKMTLPETVKVVGIDWGSVHSFVVLW